jgi:pimeloyl-ACP methyl ester carboxylesterase
MRHWIALLVLFAVPRGTVADSNVGRHDFFVTGEPGVRLFVREVVGQSKNPLPILLIHGARVPGLASFDLDVAGGSLAADLASRGLDVYVMDVRGYGRSTRPRQMEEAQDANPPLVRSNEAARDIGSVVDWIRARRKGAKVALFGWATGGQWAGYYAALYPSKLSALITLNSLYGGSQEHQLLGHGSDMEDPEHPGRYNPKACGAYRWNDEKSLLRGWDRSIPGENEDAWRDPAVAKAYVEAALASDPAARSHIPHAFRSPCGALEDSFYLAIGRKLWDASLITVPTLVLASEKDFWSRPADRELLRQELVHSPEVKVVVLPNATHFVHLDRPERGRNQLLEEVMGLLRSGGKADE